MDLGVRQDFTKTPLSDRHIYFGRRAGFSEVESCSLVRSSLARVGQTIWSSGIRQPPDVTFQGYEKGNGLEHNRVPLK